MSTNTTTRRVYTAEFKREAVQLAKTSGKTKTEIERELGLSSGLLKHWMSQAEAEGEHAFPGPGTLWVKLNAEEEELRRLRRENEILRQERDILKKVVAIFSEGVRPTSQRSTSS